MSLDSRYLASAALEQYLVDKDTGFPLAAGQVFFWQDNNRSTPKSVYAISGSPPNYSFVALPNPITLNSSGVPVDGSGNIVVPYYFPFDSNGNVQLYYVAVFSSLGVPQYTLQAWPPNAAQDSLNQADSNINLIPNGQFLLHNNIPFNVITGTPAGQISGPITSIAPGGWTFERPITSTATDNITFYRFPSYTTNPTASPRYAVQLTTNGSSPSDAFKDIRIKFNDVNKFASDTQEYTIFFSAISISGGNIPVNLNIVKNYGTGGSPQQIINVTTFNVNSVQNNFSFPIIFGSNAGKTIGPNDDDFVQISASFPVNNAFISRVDDFVLYVGDVDVVQFPTTTNSDFIGRSLIPPVPDYNGYNLGLPLIETNTGLAYDTSQIGKIIAAPLFYPEYGELLCDGSVYRSKAYSTDGIPYRRLRNKLIQVVADPLMHNIPVFGTGLTYVLASHINNDGTFFISTQQPGLQPLTADGAAPTGFTFTSVCPGQASPLVKSYCSTAGVYWVYSNNIGFSTTANSSTTPTQVINASPSTYQGEIVGTSQAAQVIQIISNSVPAGGTSIRINTAGTGFLVPWFTLDGVGTSPGGSGTLLKINLLSNMGYQDTAYGISQSLSGNQVSTVQTVSGASIPPNSYFTFYANGQLYYVWYSLNGIGTDPNVAGGIGIPVSFTVSQTALTVMMNTYSAINDVYFAVPDLRGWTIKGWNGTNGVDSNILNRFEFAQTRFTSDFYALPGYIGSYQNNSLLSHGHQPILGAGSTISGANRFVTNTYTSTSEPTTSLSGLYIDETGNAQNDVKNVYLNYIIKY